MGKEYFMKWCQDNWTSTFKRIKLDSYFTPTIKVNSRWINSLNIRVKIIKLLGENIGVNLKDLEFDYRFLDMTPATRKN